MLSSVRDADATAAARRRQRRLRQFFRHERLSVNMAVAEMQHHADPRGQSMARAGDEDHEVHFTATIRANAPPQAAGTEYFSLDVDDVPAAWGVAA